MPYTSMGEVNPAIKGIKPPVTLAQANHIARMADAIERKGGAENPWAAAIAQFKELYIAQGGRWVLRKKTRASEAATEAEINAQKARSRKYGISIRKDGNVTKPGEWSHVPDSEFGDPVNYSYPCPDKKQTQAALRYWGKPKNKGKYSSKDQGIITARLKRFAKKFKVGDYEEGRRAEEQVSHTGRVLGAVEGTEGKEWDVVLIEAGEEANGRFYWTPEVLEREAHVFEGAKSYDIHLSDEEFRRNTPRPTRDILGVIKNPRWDATIGNLGGIRGTYHVIENWLREKLLALSEAGTLDILGLSVDTISGVVNKEVKGRVLMAITGIKKVLSVDVVGEPAAGGRFERLIAGKEGKEVMNMEVTKEDLLALIKEGVQDVLGEEPPEDDETRVPESEEEEGGEEDKVSKALNETKRAVEQVRVQACATLLDTKLQASKLPQSFHPIVRDRFEGRVFEAKELDDAIAAALKAIAETSRTGEPEGVGYVVNVGPDPLRKLEIAAHRLFGAELDDEMKKELDGVPRLSGIRELYLMLTGDYDMRGVFNPDAVRISEANVNTGTVTSLVKNVLNKVLLQEYRRVPPWWGPVVSEEDFSRLQQITLAKTGLFGDLPTVSEGAAYTELTWGDIEETADWLKKGGFIGVTLEAIDRDDVGGIRRIPRELGRAARRTLSSAIAAIFTDNSGAGPVMADTYNLFDASNHGNLLTTALSASEWETVVAAVYKQADPVASKRLGLRPTICLVPIELEMTARRIFEQPWEQADSKQYETLLRGAAQVVVVPEWTDATDWAAVVRPTECDGIVVCYRFGREPELFAAQDPTSGSMFTNDQMRIKVRFFYAVGVADYRPLHKSNVAG